MLLGDRLRTERLGKGLALEDVSRLLRISVVNLEAIESNRFQDLPGQFFAKSFLRQYARLLNIYDDEVERRIQEIASFQAAPALPGAESPHEPIQVPPVDFGVGTAGSERYLRVLKPVAVFLLVVAGSSAIYVAWERFWAGGHSPASTPRAVAQQAAPTAESTPAEAVSPAVTPAAAGEAETAPAMADSGGAQGGESRYSVNLLLTAQDQVWVRVVCDGKEVFQGLMNTGESRSFGGSEAARLVIGNAGGLTITWNGKKVGPLGNAGQVRVVQFTPQQYEFVAPAPRKPAEPSDWETSQPTQST